MFRFCLPRTAQHEVYGLLLVGVFSLQPDQAGRLQSHDLYQVSPRVLLRLCTEPRACNGRPTFFAARVLQLPCHCIPKSLVTVTIAVGIVECEDSLSGKLRTKIAVHKKIISRTRMGGTY